MKRVIALLVAVALFSPLAACGPRENYTELSNPDDPQMIQAEEQARATLPVFWQALDSKDPSLSDFSIKVGLPVGEGSEHIWVESIDRKGETLSGALANDPVRLQGMKYGSRVTFTPDQISDWGFLKDGKLRGHFTTRVLMPRMSDAERAQISAMLASDPLEGLGS